MSPHVLPIFDTLADALLANERAVLTARRAATERNDPAEATKLSSDLLKIRSIGGHIEQLRGEYEKLSLPNLTDSVPASAGSRLRDIQSANIPSANGPTRQTTGPRGWKTPGRDYRLPILVALVRLGGRGHKHRVLLAVREIMDNRLTPADLQRLETSPDERWWKTASFERQLMVDEGLLNGHAGRGFWEITDKGRAWLNEHIDAFQRDYPDEAV